MLILTCQTSVTDNEVCFKFDIVWNICFNFYLKKKSKKQNIVMVMKKLCFIKNFQLTKHLISNNLIFPIMNKPSLALDKTTHILFSSVKKPILRVRTNDNKTILVS